MPFDPLAKGSRRQGVIRLGRNKRRDAAASVRHIFPRHFQRHEHPRSRRTPVALCRRKLKPLVRQDPGLGRGFRQAVKAGAMMPQADVVLGSGIAQVHRLHLRIVMMTNGAFQKFKQWI